MKTKILEYRNWISSRVSHENGYGYAMCKEMCEEMTEQFPELELRKGFYHSAGWGIRPHWWLRVKETGEIVDPTGRQHPDGLWFPTSSTETGKYEDCTSMSDMDIANIMPVKCMNCGKQLRGEGKIFCNADCQREAEEYIMRGVP